MDLTSHLAIVGKLPAGIGMQPVKTSRPPAEVLVRYRFAKYVALGPNESDRLDISDCTWFTVIHQNIGDHALDRKSTADLFLEQALDAVSELCLWTKATDQVQKWTPFLRQVGRADTKLFVLELPARKMVVWFNPIHRPDTLALAGIFPNMRVTNAPSREAFSPVVRRVMASLDLINLGFYTESFVNIFAVLDDLTQEVLKAGLAKRGLTAKEQQQFLRAVKEERLKLYLDTVMKSLGGTSLAAQDPALFKRVLAVNTLRNGVMHGDTRLDRREAIDACNSILTALAWLGTNQFGYRLPQFPKLALADAEFHLFDMPPDDIAPEANATASSAETAQPPAAGGPPNDAEPAPSDPRPGKAG